MGSGSVPLGWQPHLYRGWTLAWLRDGKPAEHIRIEALGPLAQRFRLKQPRDMKAGDRFEVSPGSLNWAIHDNLITGCLRPVVLIAQGSDTSVLKDNVISRGGAAEAKQAIQILRGQFKTGGNLFTGFEQP